MLQVREAPDRLTISHGLQPQVTDSDSLQLESPDRTIPLGGGAVQDCGVGNATTPGKGMAPHGHYVYVMYRRVSWPATRSDSSRY
jgi:hypothetical protein